MVPGVADRHRRPAGRAGGAVLWLTAGPPSPRTGLASLRSLLPPPSLSLLPSSFRHHYVTVIVTVTVTATTTVTASVTATVSLTATVIVIVASSASPPLSLSLPTSLSPPMSLPLSPPLHCCRYRRAPTTQSAIQSDNLKVQEAMSRSTALATPPEAHRVRPMIGIVTTSLTTTSATVTVTTSDDR